MTSDTGWFEGAVRPDHVRTLLDRDVPPFASGELRLLGCEISRLRSSPRDGHWTGTYRLTVAEPSGGPARTVVLHGTLVPPGAVGPTGPPAVVPFGAAGWSCHLPDVGLELQVEAPDADLPGLALLTDPTAARDLLEDLLRRSHAGYDDLRLASVTPVVTDAKPGVRCTIRCDLAYEAGADPRWPAGVIAKLHRDDTGARVHLTMQALWSSPLGTSGHVALARPLAHLPEWGLLVQGLVPGTRTLKDLLHAALAADDTGSDAELAAAMRRTGRGLAELHRCGVPDGRPVTWSDELAVVRAKHRMLAGVVPRLAALGPGVYGRLEAAAAAAPADPLVPSHHSFRPSEVLLDDGRVGFVDFDKFCRAEPASDLASFTTKVRHAGMNKLRVRDQAAAEGGTSEGVRSARRARTDAICADFLAGYEEGAAVSRDRLALWEALELCSLTLSAAKKADDERIDSCVSMVEHHLDVHGL